MSTGNTRLGNNGCMADKVTRFLWTIIVSSIVLFVVACNTTSIDVRKKQEQSGQQSTSSAGQSGGGGQSSEGQNSQNGSQDGAQGGDEGIIGESAGAQAGNASSGPPAGGIVEDEDGAGAGPRHVGSAGSGAGHVIPDAADVADVQDDDIVARQLREQAEQEKDSELREKLWDEYRRYKAGQ